jgi:hypothetical protein
VIAKSLAGLVVRRAPDLSAVKRLALGVGVADAIGAAGLKPSKYLCAAVAKFAAGVVMLVEGS